MGTRPGTGCPLTLPGEAAAAARSLPAVAWSPTKLPELRVHSACCPRSQPASAPAHTGTAHFRSEICYPEAAAATARCYSSTFNETLSPATAGRVSQLHCPGRELALLGEGAAASEKTGEVPQLARRCQLAGRACPERVWEERRGREGGSGQGCGVGWGRGRHLGRPPPPSERAILDPREAPAAPAAPLGTPLLPSLCGRLRGAGRQEHLG